MSVIYVSWEEGKLREWLEPRSTEKKDMVLKDNH